MFKYQQAEEFAAEQAAIGAAIVIDSDDGDPGRFAWPVRRSTASDSRPPSPRATWTTAGASFGRSGTLFPLCRLRSEAELRQLGREVSAAVTESIGETAAARTREIAETYARLETKSALKANLIVRRQAGIGGRLLELPLSEFAAFPEVRAVISDLIDRARDFATVCNGLLDEFRDEHRIRNAANPFPNLRVEPTRVELPFWAIDPEQATRAPLHKVTTDRGVELMAGGRRLAFASGTPAAEMIAAIAEDGLELVPRGALITGLLRLLVSDLFVHGTGGGKYDQFTARLIHGWWSVPPTPFVVASASRYLFGEERAELARLESLAGRLRDLAHNPQRSFGDGVFCAATESRLQELTANKAAAVEELKAARAAGQSARDIGHRIQELTDAIRDLVESEFAPQLRRLESISAESRATLSSRTWPWMLFPPADRE